MIHKVCLDLLGRLIKAEGECCALEDFSRLRELLLLLWPVFLFFHFYFCLVSVLFFSGLNPGLWCALGYLDLLFHCPFLPGGHCLSSKLSCVIALLWGSSTQHLVVVALGMFPCGKCHQLAYLAPSQWIYFFKQKKWHSFLGFSAKLYWVCVGDRKYSCWLSPDLGDREGQFLYHVQW